jgi:hypothetical protein
MWIHDYIGRGASHSLVLEMMYYWIPYQTFLDATDDLLLIDSILFHQKNSGYINECFIARGFRLRADVIHQAGDQDDIRILNSLAFSNGEGNISFEANQAYNIQIYDITGQLILEAEDCRNYTIEPERLVKGTYVAIIRTEDRYLQIKFLR